MRWLPVVGYEGFYEVSERGDVRSLPRYVNHWSGKQCLRKGKVLKPASFGGDYLHVTLCREGTERTAKIHLIVAAAFKGPRPQGLITRHHDGNSRNNHYTNILYGTHQENSDDKKRHGRIKRGSQINTAKLTEAKVRQIRRLLAKHSQAKLAERFGVSNQLISRIKLGEIWEHVT